MKNAKSIAEWDNSTGGANVSINGNAVDVFTLLVVITIQIFDQMKLSDFKGLLRLAGGIKSARKVMLVKVDFDALRRASEEQGHE